MQEGRKSYQRSSVKEWQEDVRRIGFAVLAASGNIVEMKKAKSNG